LRSNGFIYFRHQRPANKIKKTRKIQQENKQTRQRRKLRKKRKGKTNPTVVHNISLMHVRPLRACEQSEMNERMNERMNEWHA